MCLRKFNSTSIDFRGNRPKRTNANINFLLKTCCPYLTTLVSGSPIIQNGKLVGAVTHVLINDPTTGYGIFIENMLNQMGDLAS